MNHLILTQTQLITIPALAEGLSYTMHSGCVQQLLRYLEQAVSGQTLLSYQTQSPKSARGKYLITAAMKALLWGHE